MNNIQWYPGHMTKTRRMMEENISLVDIVIELVDARIPYSSKNPDLDTLAKNKHRILLLNKCDLADERATDIWQEYFEKQGFRVIRINALKGNGLGEVTETARGLMKEKIEKLINELPEKVDISSDKEYQSLKAQIESKEEYLSKMNSGAELRQQLKIKKHGLTDELAIVEKQIASADNSAKEERIEELETEMREIAQSAADEEKMLYMLEQFMKAKMQIIDRRNENCLLHSAKTSPIVWIRWGWSLFLNPPG